MDDNQALILSRNRDVELDQRTQRAIQVVDSAHTRRAYKRAIKAFVRWLLDEGLPLTRHSLGEYKEMLRQERGDDVTNQALAAIRLFARELKADGELTESELDDLLKVSNITVRGVRVGNWLTKTEAEQLLHMPDTSHLYGLRDRAILAVLIGCWLRRSEAANLTFTHIQERDGEWCIINLKGKRNKFRSFAIPKWTKAIIDKWAEAAKIEDGHIFRQMTGSLKTNNTKIKVLSDPISDKAIARTVKRYTEQLEKDFAAHDLRRTGATLALDGEGDLRAIQLQLGHDSLATTDEYLGRREALRNPIGNAMKLKVKV